MNIILLILLILFILFIIGRQYQLDEFSGGGVSYPFGDLSAYVRRSYPCGYRGYPYDTIYPTSTPYPSSSFEESLSSSSFI
jgi:hypothetical protein